MITKKHVIGALSSVLLLVSACEDESSNDSSGGSGNPDSDGDDTSSGGTNTGGNGSGASASGGNSPGGTGPGGDGGDDDIDFDDGEEIGGDGDGLGGAGGESPETGGSGGTGGGTGGSGGGEPIVPVSASIKASITKQLTPLEPNDPFLLEVGTLTYYPVTLENPSIVVPEGWVLSRVESAGGQCPRLQNGTQRCLQMWQAYVYPEDGVCQLNQSEFVWSWDATCAQGANCSVMPTNLPDPVTFTTKHTSEYFCEVGIDLPAFLPSSALIMPTTGTDPVTIRYFTSLADPYRFMADSASVPDGMSLVGFSQSSVACNDSNFPNGCRQWWDLVVDPGAACTASGDYTVKLDVGCKSGGNCDPNVTEYTHHFKLVDRRDLCGD